MPKGSMKIKKGMEKKWDEYVKVNGADDYSKACIECTIKMGKYIDAGKTFDDAERLLLRTKLGKHLTAMMVVMIIRGLFKFHERGQEIVEWWNKKHGITKADEAKLASITSKKLEE